MEKKKEVEQQLEEARRRYSEEYSYYEEASNNVTSCTEVRCKEGPCGCPFACNADMWAGELMLILDEIADLEEKLSTL